jgi:hypothetical protein
MSDDAQARLKKLEESLGGPNGSPLLIGCDESPQEIAEALECLDPDTEYRLAVREMDGAETYVITARTPTPTELGELVQLMERVNSADDEDQDEVENDSGDDD